MKIENCDVVIIGSGVAGLICALTLDKSFKIILLTKKKLKDSNSYLAQGGISVCRGKEDREDYIEDTLIAGHYKNNREAVEILVDESEEAIKTLIKNGVKFTGDKKGLFYTREGGHRKFRILYCEDQTGKYIMESLIEKLLERDNIKIIENSIKNGMYVVSDDYSIACKLQDIKGVVDATGNPPFGAILAMEAIENRKHTIMLNVECDAVFNLQAKGLRGCPHERRNLRGL